MKKYILIGDTTGIGGWQLYIDARCQHIRAKKEWSLYLISSKPDDCTVIKLENIKNSERLMLDEFRYPPYCFSKKQIENALSKVKAFIAYDFSDEIFVESTCMDYSLWGELVAQSTNGVAFAYLLHSHTENTPIARQKFFAYKYKQTLIGGQSDITLPDLFRGLLNTGADVRTIAACWENPICEDRADCIDIREKLQSYHASGKKIIGYFGTLNKPHFMLLCQQIEQYVSEHSGDDFAFISIGSSRDGVAEARQMQVSHNVSNCDAYNIPEMYPVPYYLFKALDICIASWGSSIVAARECQRTIRLLDDVKLIPQGVIGITLKEESNYALLCCDESMSEIYDTILYGENYSGIAYLPPKPAGDVNEQQTQIDTLMQPYHKKELDHKYYDVTAIRCCCYTERRIKFLHLILGVKTTSRLRCLARKYKSKEKRL